MRRIVGAAFCTLDGVIQGPGGPSEDPTGGFKYSGWLPPVGDDAIDEKIGELFGRPFDLLLGRRTYEIFAAYWPYAPDEMAQIRDPFDDCTKYVVTHRDDPLEWKNSQRVGQIEELRAIKQGHGPDLVIQGSSTLYPPLLSAGLIDRLILMRFPIILGHGRRIFDGSETPGALKLVDHAVSDKGVVFTSYEPDGEVQTGSFETKEPSKATLALREKFAREDS